VLVELISGTTFWFDGFDLFLLHFTHEADEVLACCFDLGFTYVSEVQSY
jgi:hypothetical protein